MRLLREAAELTRTELGRRIGVSERQIYDWENGIKLPRIDRAVALARELGVPLQTVCRALGTDVTGLVEDKPAPRFSSGDASLTQSEDN